MTGPDHAPPDRVPDTSRPPGYEAREQSQQYNAPGGSITVNQHGQPAGVLRRPWMAPPLNPGMVDRPEVSGRLLGLVCQAGSGPVAVMGMHGTGGFGKTTLAVWLCHQPRVRERFAGGLLWATVGEHVTGAELADRINDLVEQLTDARPGFTDPLQAGFRLGELLDSQPDPVLLVLDDIWTEDQLKPFLAGGTQCRRLVTTRQRWLLPDAGNVPVDEMNPAQAAALLTRDVPGAPMVLVKHVLAATGRWPVLLDLANRALARSVGYGTAADRALGDMLERLTTDGPRTFDMDNPTHRSHAVGATVRAGLDLLPATAADRLAELAIFAEDTDIPIIVLELLWAATGGLTGSGVRRVCEALADLSLLLAYRADLGTIRLHDVIRSYLLHGIGTPRLEELHGLLLDTAAQVLPISATGAADAPSKAWWLLPERYGYLTSHLAAHLAGAGRREELTATVTDLRWVAARLSRHGPAAVDADLAHVAHSPTAASLARAIRQNAHLLTPIEPPHALGAVLANRLDGIPALESLLNRYLPALPLPRLANRWRRSDQPHPALLRTLTGHPDAIGALAVAPDGTWLASASADGTIRIWDPATGACRHTLTDHTSAVSALAVAPNGTWLASGSDDGTVRIWDPATGACRHTLTDHTSAVSALAVAPNGTW
ncbi:NB-ARC domain-containing protein, partial [Micromonospora purpureochromogenes]|uniref:NB-ARC domain-containing protein n=1 Tax=Micromonospora purpureochromogenes TaxID=47872 RepID=UPI003642D40E